MTIYTVCAHTGHVYHVETTHCFTHGCAVDITIVQEERNLNPALTPALYIHKTPRQTLSLPAPVPRTDTLYIDIELWQLPTTKLYASATRRSTIYWVKAIEYFPLAVEVSIGGQGAMLQKHVVYNRVNSSPTLGFTSSE